MNCVHYPRCCHHSAPTNAATALCSCSGESIAPPSPFPSTVASPILPRALDNKSTVGAHHLPLSFDLHVPKFHILIFS
ncbi:hypothetical protein DEO72_LG8g2597 [Vigna unguiculata]|uniref:Uncharacterized protein n=1 Tax=Vigna unguiculata TaxID=3917 RepID=A0A4D6MV85_VIGUN|nr:hypothetical protein DEO72_LG8g2597 [Vigna unguiculata]